MKDIWRLLRPLGHVHYWARDSINLTLQTTGFQIFSLQATDLWEASVSDGLRSAAVSLIEKFGWGNQWLVVAKLEPVSAASKATK